SPRNHPLRSELLAAPRADDQIGFPRDHFLRRHNTVLGRPLTSTIGESVDAADNLDELRDPPNSGDKLSVGCSRSRTCSLLVEIWSFDLWARRVPDRRHHLVSSGDIISYRRATSSWNPPSPSPIN